MSQTDAYLEKSPDASRMGKAAEYLVASVCILATRGRLNVSTTIVDDEGVDLCHLRDSSATLAVQVKARMTDGVAVGRGRFQAQVQSQTFRPRAHLAMLFVLIDNARGSIRTAWLVPSTDFRQRSGTLTTRGNYRFSAAIDQGSADKWSSYRLAAVELPLEIMQQLEALEALSS